MKQKVIRIIAAISGHQKETAAILALAIIFAVPWLINNPAVVGAAATERELPIYCVERENKCVSLTFDAAWGAEDTQKLIDALGEYDVKATFFVVGQWVDKYPEAVKALAEAGHEIMSHSDDHAHFNKLSESEILENLQSCNKKIQALTGVQPALFRCPYGEYDDHVIRTVKSGGMIPIQWNVDSLDWQGLSAEEITKRVMSRVTPGSIVLFHNAAKYTPEALPTVLRSLLKEGYEIMPVSKLLLKEDYTIDHTGMQRRASKREAS